MTSITSRAKTQKIPHTGFILLASLIGFAARAVEYALLGAFIPLYFLMAVVISLGLARVAGPSIMKIAIRVWGVILCLYAIARLVMFGLIRFGPPISAHATDSFSYIHAGLSLLYLGAGLYLLKNAGKA